MMPTNEKNTLRTSIVGMLTGAIFCGGVVLAVVSGHFWAVFFLTLALTSLVGSLSAPDPKAIAAGIHGCIFLAGIAFLAVSGWWWPGILVLIGISTILGTLGESLVMLISRQMVQVVHAPKYDPPFAMQDRPVYRPYQQGYPLQERAPAAESERQEEIVEDEASSAVYEQPQTQYPQMPPIAQ